MHWYLHLCPALMVASGPCDTMSQWSPALFEGLCRHWHWPQDKPPEGLRPRWPPDLLANDLRCLGQASELMSYCRFPHHCLFQNLIKLFCTDYRKVNAVTKPDSFPLPRMDNCVDRVGSAKWLTKLDLLKGYWQVLLTKHASEISAFVTPGHFFFRLHRNAIRAEKCPCHIPATDEHCFVWGQ